MANLASGGIGMAAILAGGVIYLALRKDHGSLLQSMHLSKSSHAEEESGSKNDSKKASSSKKQSKEERKEINTVSKTFLAGEAPECKKKKKKVRFAEDVVSPKGNNQEYRRHPRSNRKDQSISPQGRPERGAPSVMRAGLDRKRSVEALVGSKLPEDLDEIEEVDVAGGEKRKAPEDAPKESDQKPSLVAGKSKRVKNAAAEIAKVVNAMTEFNKRAHEESFELEKKKCSSKEEKITMLKELSRSLTGLFEKLPKD